MPEMGFIDSMEYILTQFLISLFAKAMGNSWVRHADSEVV
jgi:hypothetical protein